MTSDLIRWKYIWDLVLADSAFRKYYFDYQKNTYDLHIDKPSGRITGNSGTIYIPPTDAEVVEAQNKNEEPEGHFIAFEKNGDTIVVFDSSRYAFEQFSNNPQLKRKLEMLSGKRLVELGIHPQDICPGDTFCQTWSLAWSNDNLLRQFTNIIPQAGRKKEAQDIAVNNMFRIIQSISHSKAFSKYLIANAKTFDDKELGFIGSTYSNDSTKIKTTRQFIKFSKDMTIDKVRRIMMNKL